jgi:tetratricopeptide (TPR) repeat protein
MPKSLRAGLSIIVLAAAGRATQDAAIEGLQDAGKLERMGEYAAAEKLLISILKESGISASADRRIAVTFNNLGTAYHPEWARCRRKAIEIDRAAPRPGAILTARFTTNLAQVYLETGQYAKAERLELHSLAARLEASEPGDPEVTRLVATTGALAAVQRRYAEAENAYKRALASHEKCHPESDETVQLLNNLGILYRKTGRNSDALSYCERALRLAERILRPDDLRRAKLLLNVAVLQQAEHGPGAAEPFYQRALSMSESALGPQHPLVGEILANYATALQQMHRRVEAKACERRAKTILHAASEANLARYTVCIDDLRHVR